jgi:elongation factor P hydroxylase
MNEKNDRGEDFVDFPKWFTRTGRRTAQVETGFGAVDVRSVTFEEGELESNAGYITLLSALIKIPDWKAEYQIVLKGDKGPLTVSADQTLPSPGEILAKADPLLARNYWDECLPPSLMQQVLAAQAYLRLPPLVYAQAVNPQ